MSQVEMKLKEKATLFSACQAEGVNELWQSGLKLTCSSFILNAQEAEKAAAAAKEKAKQEATKSTAADKEGKN